MSATPGHHIRVRLLVSRALIPRTCAARAGCCSTSCGAVLLVYPACLLTTMADPHLPFCRFTLSLLSYIYLSLSSALTSVPSLISADQCCSTSYSSSIAFMSGYMPANEFSQDISSASWQPFFNFLLQYGESNQGDPLQWSLDSNAPLTEEQFLALQPYYSNGSTFTDTQVSIFIPLATKFHISFHCMLDTPSRGGIHNCGPLPILHPTHTSGLFSSVGYIDVSYY